MLSGYQLDQARRNSAAYQLFGGGSPRLSGCGCSGACCSTRTRGLGAAPALSATDALNQAIAAYGPYHLNSRDFKNSSWLSKAASQISAGAFDVSWYSSSCTAAQAASNLNLIKTASGLGLAAAGAGVGIAIQTGALVGAAATAATIALPVAGVVIAIILAIFEHHAAAIQRDLSFGCAALPAVNNAFSVLAQGVAGGSLSPAEVASEIFNIYQNFMQVGGASGSSSGPGSIPGGGQAINDSPYCNSNCEMSVILLGMCIYWQAQYQAMAASQAAAAAVKAAPAQASPAATPTSTLNTSAAPSAAVTPPSGQTVLPAGSVVTEQQAAAASSSVPTWLWLLGLGLGTAVVMDLV